MPAGFGGGGGGIDLPQGAHVCQIADVSLTQGKDFNDPNRRVPQFKWSFDAWVGGQWVRKTLWTGTSFSDLSKVTSQQYVSKLTRLVRACGQPLPQTAAEAAAWQEASLCGARFVIQVLPDPESGKLEQKFLPYRNPNAPVPAQQPVQATAQPAPQPAPQPQAAAAPAPAANGHAYAPNGASQPVPQYTADPAPAAPPAPASPPAAAPDLNAPGYDPFADPDPGAAQAPAPPAAPPPPAMAAASPVAGAQDIWSQ